MVLVPGDRFKMGSDGKEADGDEKPPHMLRVAPFALAKYEVTRGEFGRFAQARGYRTEAELGGGCYGWDGKSWKMQREYNWKSAGFPQSDDQPVVCVSMNDANAYLEWLSEETGKGYRLPTEAEWEQAARAGKESERFWGDDSAIACEFANVGDRSGKERFGFTWAIHECTDGYETTAPVGRFKPNGFGLHDILGNVWEWSCSEIQSPFGGGESKCSSKDRLGAFRVLRGGSWTDPPARVRSAYRGANLPGDRANSIGFRPARVP